MNDLIAETLIINKDDYNDQQLTASSQGIVKEVLSALHAFSVI